MQKRKRFLPTFLILLIISFVIFSLSSFGFLSGLRGVFESATVPIQRAVFGLSVTKGSEIEKLREANRKLAAQIVTQTKNEREIAALRAQFDTWDGSPRGLLPANVMGRSAGFLIIDQGARSGLARGDAVIVEENLIGVIDKVSAQVSKVRIILHDEISFTAETLSSESVGVVKGTGTGIVLENVVLSDTLSENDLVVTRGGVDEEGAGLVPGLVVGRIVSVNRTESALFQSAEVKSLVDFGRVRTVFVLNDNDNNN